MSKLFISIQPKKNLDNDLCKDGHIGMGYFSKLKSRVMIKKKKKISKVGKYIHC